MDTQIIENVQHLENRGYFAVEAQQAQFAQVAHSILKYAKDFFSQTPEQKALHAHSKTTGLGYEYRGPEDPNEYKETLHLDLGYEPSPGATIEDRRLMGFSKLLIQSLAPTVEFVAQVISIASKKELVSLITSSLQTATLRFLYYPPDLPDMKREFLATEHVDKGFTIHIGETCSGLQVHWNEEWIDVDEIPGYVHGYAGMLGQFYTECSLTALRHRVVPTPTSRTEGRYAIVLFLDPGDFRYDKARCGRTQDSFGKGENYGMPFAEFKKYFALKETATAM